MNPYDFVRLADDEPQRHSPHLHDRFAGRSGRIVCTLTTRTHIFVPRFQGGGRSMGHERLALNRDVYQAPLIPGSSLKGVIRSVAEAASSSCFMLPRAFLYDRRKVRYILPERFEPCSRVEKRSAERGERRNRDGLCPACRLFGMLNRGNVFTGNVSVRDAVAPRDAATELLTLAVLSSPKPRHKAFYSTRPDSQKPQVRGRKFYYHRPQGFVGRTQQDGQNKTVEAVAPGVAFTFEVEYENVEDEDLGLLLFALTLWDDTCHKVGMGKPIGMGSAKIDITELTALDPKARYAKLGAGWKDPLKDKGLSEFVDAYIRALRDSTAGHLQDLRRILHWHEGTSVDVHYPDYNWFKANPWASLEEAP
jgi:CRISPR/Cas system CSM-associated protein Csm3 (group 7 of RAMP superfamily)